jgi:hypothetical protein
VAEDENLQLLRPLTTAKEHDELEQAADDDLHSGHNPRRPPADGNADASEA